MNISGISYFQASSQVLDNLPSFTKVMCVAVPVIAGVAAAALAIKINRDQIYRYGLTHKSLLLVKLARVAGSQIYIHSGYGPFYKACRKGDLTAAQFFFNLGYKIDDDLINYALRLAYAQDNLKALQCLFNLGGKIDIDEKQVNVALRKACSKGHLNAVRSLVQNGAKIDIFYDLKKTPLQEACIEGHLNIVQFLVENGANPDFSSLSVKALNLACIHNHFDVAKYLIDKGAQIEEALIFTCVDNDEISPSLKFLVAHITNISCLLKPLYWSLNEGHLKVARFLIETGAPYNQPIFSHYNLLYYACSKFPLFPQAMLLISCAQAKDNRFRFIRDRAIGINARLASVDFINMQNRRGETALHVLAKNTEGIDDDSVLDEKIDLWKFMLKNGALLLPNSKGETPDQIFSQNHGFQPPMF